MPMWSDSILLSILFLLPYFFLFILGIFVGSFLNVVADRVYRKESFIKGRSYCEFCNTFLKVIDLIPVLSFATTFGKCRYCKKRLSLSYPLSELLTGVLFVFALALSQYTFSPTLGSLAKFFYLLTVFSAYMIIFLADFKYQIIPNKIVIPTTVFVITVSVLTTPLFALPSNVISGLLLMGLFWFLYAITKEKGMGFGDVRLALLIGFFHPFPLNLVAIFGSFVIGAIFSVFLMFFGKAGMKSKIAFGPFMIGASVLTLFVGQQIVNWYTYRWLGY